MRTQSPLQQNKQQIHIPKKQLSSPATNMKSGRLFSNTTSETITRNFFSIAIIAFIVTTLKYIFDTFYELLLKQSPLVIIQEDSNAQSTGDVKGAPHHDDDKEEEEKEEPKDILFPSMNTTSDSGSIKEQKAEECLVPTSCSMGLTTRLLPVKNENGELEWVFTEDDSVLTKGAELDAFKIPQPHNLKQREIINELSPTMSNSSNETTLSAKLESNTSLGKEQSVSPNDSSHESSSPYMEEDFEEGDGGDKSFQCPHCDATFKIRGYLTRHLKKHSSSKAYSCPFYSQSIYRDENNITHKCHPNGGFSRRDTYKTHLKSRHFNYPKGIKTKNRGNSEGHCSMCGEYFNSAEIWCEIHVEGGECKFLPQDYKGKSRLKNRLKKKLQKNEEITDPELLPFASKVLEEVKQQRIQKRLARKERKKKSLKQQVQEQHQFRNDHPNPAYHHLNAPVSTSPPQHMDTPTSIASSSQYESCSTHSPFTPQTSKSPLGLMTNNYVKEDQAHVHIAVPHHQPQPQYIPTPYRFDHITTAHDPKPIIREDYDDEYCLDVDQLSPASTRQYNEVAQIYKMQQQQPSLQEQMLYEQHQQQQQQQYFQTVQRVGSQYMN
ncbi:STP2 [Candida margitis]|uniref:STP2 n=1 Tax=Candida margitis TaxID=1775924 RepID=UPI002225C27B|nr:STP2 [Candida margitis]KAI5969636.1 STP2 [Candida margitis]